MTDPTSSPGGLPVRSGVSGRRLGPAGRSILALLIAAPAAAAVVVGAMHAFSESFGVGSTGSGLNPGGGGPGFLLILPSVIAGLVATRAASAWVRGTPRGLAFGVVGGLLVAGLVRLGMHLTDVAYPAPAAAISTAGIAFTVTVIVTAALLAAEPAGPDSGKRQAADERFD